MNSLHIIAFLLAFQPTDNGIGVRMDWGVRQFEIYNSVSYGDWGAYRAVDLRNHVKVSAGTLIPLKDQRNCQYRISLGVNYHYCSRYPIELPHPLSFELGLTLRGKRISVGVRTDIPRWEPCIDIGIKL